VSHNVSYIHTSMKLHCTRLLALGMLLALAVPAMAADYKVDTQKSSIRFSGEHAETPFKGAFEEWQASISFDPEKLETSKLDVTIDTKSAKTGNAMYDGTLPSEDWFDVEAYPHARFVSESIERAKDGSYNAKGTLTIRDVTKPFTLPFTLKDVDATGKKAEANAAFKINRLSFDLGKESDGSADWVSRDIDVRLYIVAVRL